MVNCWLFANCPLSTVNCKLTWSIQHQASIPAPSLTFPILPFSGSQARPLPVPIGVLNGLELKNPPLDLRGWH